MTTRERPTAEQLEHALRLRPGTITFERPAEWPRPGDPFKILATVRDGGHGNWRVRLEEALPRLSGNDQPTDTR